MSPRLGLNTPRGLNVSEYNGVQMNKIKGGLIELLNVLDNNGIQIGSIKGSLIEILNISNILNYIC